MDEAGEGKTERRRFHVAGISAATVVSLAALGAGGLISWGSASQRIDETSKKNTEQDERFIRVEGRIDNRIDALKQEIKLEIHESEQRTRQDIQELRRAVLTGAGRP